MELTLQLMKLTNFKGITSLEVHFDQHVQNIYGQNGVGKSTLFTAFLWCLFGKDAEGRSDYQVKTTDETGAEVHHLENTVELLLRADNQEITLKRALKEKWKKPRGQAQEVFDGNETEYFWNDVPMRERDYQIKVSGIIDESLFKLLTNPLYFNTGLSAPKVPDWQARRRVLLELAGPISDKDLAKGNPDFERLLQAMAGKDEREWRAELNAKKRKLVEQLDQIDPRINEVLRGLPQTIDFDALERSILAKEREISDVDAAIQNVTDGQAEKDKEQLARQAAIYGHKQSLQRIEAEIRADSLIAKSDRENELKTLRASVRSLDTELVNLGADKRRLEGHTAQLEARMGQLREEWHRVDGSAPNPDSNDYKCPSCHQELPEDQREGKKKLYDDYVKNFNANKVKRKDDICEEGAALKTQADTEGITISNLTSTIAAREADRQNTLQLIAQKEADAVRLSSEGEDQVRQQLTAHETAIDLRAKVVQLELDITAANTAAPDNSELKTRRQFLQSDLDALKTQRSIKEQINRGNGRVEELKKDQSAWGQELASIQQLENIALEFGKKRIAIVEDRINHKFKVASFKMFHTQVDGTVIECCETMLGGVVFGALNTGGRLQVGIDIIGALSAHYGVSAPIFIDNRESVFLIPDIDSQIINLIAMEDVDRLVFDKREALEIASRRNHKQLQTA